MKTTLACLAIMAALALPAAADSTMAEMDHSSHGMAEGAATEAYRAANMKMHQAMDIDFSGDADVDFVRGMIAHHQGAIDMAKAVLAHGSDPEVRKLAEGVIAAQEAEIAWMKAWLAEKGL